MTNIQYIKSQTQLPEKAIENTLSLLTEGCTIPFIARYRKDSTQNLDEVAIEHIAKSQADYDNICKRKETILSSIEEQGKLTDELRKRIENSFELNELEDLYLPYKKRRKTKADVAKENGLEPLAKQIMSQRVTDLELLAGRYLSNKVPTEEEALQGASDIIAEWINENTFIRRTLRRIFQRKAIISSEVAKGKNEEEEAQKYAQYFDWEEALNKAPSHRILAMLRAEKEGFVKLKVQVDNEETLPFMEENIIKSRGEVADFLKKTVKDSYKRLLEPSISNETLQEAKDKADAKAISVFAENLSQLLLASPLGEKRILAIDPGYRTGCKVVCLDEKGDLLHHDVIYPHAPQNDMTVATKKLSTMVSQYNIQAISIGNGTASRETESFVRSIAFPKKVEVFVVSEAGASVYSASKIARDEFPNYDVTVRGAVSIGRRLADPLAELVNKVGVNLNTASKSLLSYVSGIGEKMAKNIVAYRSANGAFSKREDLKKVPRLGDKVYQQAVAFLRVHNSENPLDNSALHPEAYPIIKQMAKDTGISVAQLIGNKQAIATIDIQKYKTDKVGELYLKDVLKELEKPGLDPRTTAKAFAFDPNVKTFDDVRIGMILPGIVNNITAFGCFVDIGVKESGLVHISQLKDAYVSDVNEVVKLHQQVQVKVIEVDQIRKRISLTMII